MQAFRGSVRWLRGPGGSPGQDGEPAGMQAIPGKKNPHRRTGLPSGREASADPSSQAGAQGAVRRRKGYWHEPYQGCGKPFLQTGRKKGDASLWPGGAAQLRRGDRSGEKAGGRGVGRDGGGSPGGAFFSKNRYGGAGREYRGYAKCGPGSYIGLRRGKNP